MNGHPEKPVPKLRTVKTEDEVIETESHSQPPALVGRQKATTTPSATLRNNFLTRLAEELNLNLGHDGVAYAAMYDMGNAYALPIAGRTMNNRIREICIREGLPLRRNDVREICHALQAQAESRGVRKKTWYRVAKIENGIIIDLGDTEQTRVQITAGNVEIITHGCDVLFYRTPVSQPLMMPGEVGNLSLLRKYLNIHPIMIPLFIGWLSYTIALPKQSTSKYLIMVLQGPQGSGKTSLCENIILKLIDPNQVGVQALHNNSRDLAIASQNAHVLCFDNLRNIPPAMADNLCRASTGGAISTRVLYTDSEQNVLRLHVAFVLNGIHSFIEQPDLAQRCLPIKLQPFHEKDRKSEAELSNEFQADLPAIQRGLYDLIAKIFTYLPDVEVTSPERMIDFSRWLAAMEKADGMPPGAYQGNFSFALNDGQLDSLQENVLADAVLRFAEKMAGHEWSGTPTDLLEELNPLVDKETRRCRQDWPSNSIALGIRLLSLQAGLLSQGIKVQFTRGKHRKITINK